MYAKRMDDGRIRCLERPYLIENGRIYTNPTEQQLKNAGYKPLVERSCAPEVEASYTIHYEEDDANIYLCYRAQEETA